jgi:hypothetical protein
MTQETLFQIDEYSVCVQCENASDGYTGDFVARIDGKKRYAVSPLIFIAC